MRAAICHRYGPPENVELTELPNPVAGEGEIVVDVHAAAVNFPDVLLIANKYQLPMPLPYVPGAELAGVVRSVGAGSDLSVGDRVYGLLPGGGAFAEQAVLPATEVMPIPAGMEYAEAAASGVTYQTALHALRSVARVQPGEWVVVLGAAGGVGSATLDIARLLGAETVAVVSTAEKARWCRDRGATAAIDYSSEDLRARIREATNGGAHVVIDPVGGSLSEPCLRSMRRGGRFVTLGFASGTIPALPLNLILLKGVTVMGMEMRTFPEHAPEQSRSDLQELRHLLAQGLIRPHIGARFDLGQTAAALRYVADRRVLGKVVIDIARE